MDVQDRRRNQSHIHRPTQFQEGLARKKAIEKAEQKRQESEAEGRAIGLAEGRAEIIRQLYDKGMSAEQISQILDMDINDLKNILEN